MDRYPPEITALLAPLVVIQGFSPLPKTDEEPVVKSADACIEIPPVESEDSALHHSTFDGPDIIDLKNGLPKCGGPIAGQLRSLLETHNIGDNLMPPNNGTDYSKRIMFRMRYSDSDWKIPRETSSSAISPFNPQSPYLDTILPLEWIQKYRDIVPSIFILAFTVEFSGDPQQDAKFDQELIAQLLDYQKLLAGTSTRLLGLAICEDQSVKTAVLDRRLDKIRLATNLPARVGISTVASSNPRDLAVFIESLVYMMKPWTTDIYNYRIKQLKKRTVPPEQEIYSEEFWLARQGVKTAVFEEINGVAEASVRSMEYAYEKIIGAVQSIDGVLKPEHHKVWIQCRSLLDFAGMHIVKAYFLLSDPNMAYRKFDIHVQNVQAITPDKKSYSTASWLSLQSTWLAELMDKGVPETTIPIERPLLPTPTPKWFGTSTPTTPSNTGAAATVPNALPHAGYVYMKAYEQMRERRERAKTITTTASAEEEVDPYLCLPIDEEKKFDYSKPCIYLLNGSLNFFSRAKRTKYTRAESCDYFNIGEEYYLQHNYSMAANNYLVALSIYREENWLPIVATIYMRLFKCSLKLKNIKDAQSYFLKLSVLPDKYAGHFKAQIENQSLSADDEGINDETDADDITDEGILVYKDSVFDSSVVLKDHTMLLSEPLTFQVSLRSNFNSLVENAIVETVEIQLAKTLVVVKHNSSLDSKPFNLFESKEKKRKAKFEFEANLVFAKDEQMKVLQFELHTNMVGSSQIESVQLGVNTLDFVFQNVLDLSGHPGTAEKWYVPSESGLGKDLECQVLGSTASAGQEGLKFEVIPKQPKVDVRLKYDKFAYNGQTFPVKVHFHNKDTDPYGLHYEAVAKLNGDELPLEWEDGNSADVEEFKTDAIEERTMLVKLPILKDLPTIEESQSAGGPSGEGSGSAAKHSAVVKIEFAFSYKMLNEEDVTVTTTRNLDVPIMEIFEFKFNIKPSLGSEIPSVFDFTPDHEGNVTMVPVHNRVWQAVAYVRNVSYSPLKLRNCKVEVISVSAKGSESHSHADLVDPKDGVVVAEDPIELGSNDKRSQQLPFKFVSYCDEKFLKRAIQVEVWVSFEYMEEEDGDGGNYSDSYRVRAWKGSLPHMDPRMLVSGSKQGEEVVVRYLLENPTGRVFQFSCTLGTSECFKIYEYRKQQNFVVLPFSKEEIKVRYRVVDGFEGERKLLLPELKVYDLNFKVYLNQLVVTPSIQTKNGQLYYIV